jgi:colanic acid/amylovoran biosynthesis protein
MNIGVMGASLDSPNRGVSALGISLISLCLRSAPGAQVKLLVGNNKSETFRLTVDRSEHTIPMVYCRLSPRSSLQDHLLWILVLSLVFRVVPSLRASIIARNRWIRTIVEADVIGDIRGGDSFSDIYGMRLFIEGFLLIWTVLLVKRKLVMFPQTFGPYKTFIARSLAGYVLRRCSTVIARDKQSQQVAEQLLGRQGQVLLSPDVAFSLEATRPNPIALDPPRTGDSAVSIVGLNVNGLMYNGGYTRNNMFGLTLDYAAFVKSIAVAILDETDGELWLVPHTFAPAENVESDPEACRKLKDSLPPKLQQRVRIVTAEYNASEIKGVIGMCDFFIGSRMHSCIAALSQGVPCAAVAYSMKFRGVFESVGMQEWVVDGRQVTSDEAVRRVLDLYGQREQVRQRLNDEAAAARHRLTEVFHRLFSAIAVQA